MELGRATSDVQFTFGRYETIFRIGSGGMAEVFAARLCGEAGFERLVAIKRLLPHLAQDPQYVARFLDEGRLAARVVHPHVVQTLDLGRSDEGEPFLVLELIVGNTLEQLIRREELPPVAVCLTWLAQSAEGLHAAHIARAPDGTALGLVHRDVSPHNILIGLDGDARISDFGIAQAAQLKAARTPTGQVTGKFAYFSPEQAMGQPLDARSDVFSLGIVAWEALVGRRLFQADSPAQIFDRVRTLEVPAPHKLRSDVSARVSEVVLRALQRDLGARTPDAQTFARELAELVRELGDTPGQSQRSRWVRANPDAMWQRLGTNLQFAATQAAPTRSRRWPRRSGGAALALVAVLGGGFYILPKLAFKSQSLTPTPNARADVRAAPTSASALRSRAEPRASTPLGAAIAPVPRRQNMLALEEHVAPPSASGSLAPATDADERPVFARAPEGALRPPTPVSELASQRIQGSGAAASNGERRRRRTDAPRRASALASEEVAPPAPAVRSAPLLGADAFERNLGKYTGPSAHDWGGRK